MRIRADQLQSQLGRDLAPVYLVFGDEPLLVQEAADTLRTAARGRGYEERLRLVVEPGFDWGSLGQAADSLSLFARRRLLELRLESARPGEVGGRALGAYARRPPADTVLLVICARLDAAAQKSAWVRALDAAGVVVMVRPVDARAFTGWIENRMARHGLFPSSEALDLLAERTEGNLLAAAQEIDKLRVLQGGGEVGVDAVLDAVAESARYSVFDLVDAALAGQAARAVRILEGLRHEGVEAALVSWALHREVSLLARAALAVSAGASADAALARLRVWERRRTLLGRAVSRLGRDGCLSLLRACARADRVIKGAETGRPWDGLLALTVSLAGRAPGSAPRPEPSPGEARRGRT